MPPSPPLNRSSAFAFPASVLREGIRQRLKRRAWAADWPDLNEAPSRPPDLKPVGWWESWSTVAEEAQALQGGEPLPLNRLHAFLDRLEAWSVHVSPFLTWPPTQDGFGQALAASLDNRDPDVLTVIACYPQACAQALGLIKGPRLHEASEEIVRQVLALFAPALVQKPEVPASIGAPQSIAPATPSDPAVSARAKDVGREPRPPAAPEVTKWLAQVLDRLRTPNGREPELREWVDEQWKHLRQQERADHRPNWLLDRWLPALATLPEPELQLLELFWPPHQKLSVSDPLALVGQKRFWAVLRDATARNQLTTRTLPGFIDAEGWSFEQRHGLLEPMFHMVRANPDLFEERLGLWMGWGGKLDEEALLSAPAPEGNDVFAHPSQPEAVSARGWFLSHGNPVWNEVLDRHAPARPRPRR